MELSTEEYKVLTSDLARQSRGDRLPTDRFHPLVCGGCSKVLGIIGTRGIATVYCVACSTKSKDGKKGGHS